MRWKLLALLLVTSLYADETGYIEMPEATDGSYRLVSAHGSGRAWGLPETILHLQLVAREWQARHPDGPVLRIGDISKPDGSDFPPHVTHKDGLSIDITTSSPNICHKDYEDQQLTAELARLFIDLGARQILYNHPDVQAIEPSIIREWPKHDNHFHVVVDPERVPLEGVPVLVPGDGWGNGSFLGNDRYSEGSFKPSWRLIPAQVDAAGRPRAFQTQVQLSDAAGQSLFDSGSVQDTQRMLEVAASLQDDTAYRWRVQLKGGEGEQAWQLDSGWLELHTDFVAPEVVALAPLEGIELERNPRLCWSFADSQEEQAWFAIDISTSKRQTRFNSLEVVADTATSFLLPGKLKKSKHYYWRVRAGDGHGNEALSEWAEFKVGSKYTWRPPVGRVTSETLNLRHGPGTNFGIIVSLPQKHEFYIFAEQGAWLQVRVQVGDQVQEGWLHGGYIERVVGDE